MKVAQGDIIRYNSMEFSNVKIMLNIKKIMLMVTSLKR